MRECPVDAVYKEEVAITRTMSKANTRTALTSTFRNVCTYHIESPQACVVKVRNTTYVDMLNSPHRETCDVFWTRNQPDT